MKTDELIHELRKQRRMVEMTQKELANKIGVTDSYFSLMERGKRTYSLKNFVNVCEVLRIVIRLDKGVKNDQT